MTGASRAGRPVRPLVEALRRPTSKSTNYVVVFGCPGGTLPKRAIAIQHGKSTEAGPATAFPRQSWHDGFERISTYPCLETGRAVALVRSITCWKTTL
jgi:hypothetical protein